MKQIIAEPTRTTSKTRTIIDIILVSDHFKICRSGVLEVGISVHCIVYVVRKLKRESIKQHNTLKLWLLKRYSKVNWTEVMQCVNVGMAWDRFKMVFFTSFDQGCALQRDKS